MSTEECKGIDSEDRNADRTLRGEAEPSALDEHDVQCVMVFKRGLYYSVMVSQSVIIEIHREGELLWCLCRLHTDEQPKPMREP